MTLAFSWRPLLEIVQTWLGENHHWTSHQFWLPLPTCQSRFVVISPSPPPHPHPGSCHHLSPFPPSHYKDVVRNTRLLPWTYVYNIGQWLLHVLGSVIQSAIVVHGWMEYRERVEMAAISCGTSHASAVSTPLRWILKNALEKTSHSCRITCGRSESARERRTALYKSD